MNILRLILATVAAFVAYFVVGGLAFGLIPSLKAEFLKYPAVYRSLEGQMSHMPIGMCAMFLAILALALLYASCCRCGSGLAQGARFGALIGVFVVCACVLHDFTNLNIGFRLTIQNSLAYFFEWLVVGIVIGLIYRPKPAR
jgi:hypothetical protein